MEGHWTLAYCSICTPIRSEWSVVSLSSGLFLPSAGPGCGLLMSSLCWFILSLASRMTTTPVQTVAFQQMSGALLLQVQNFALLAETPEVTQSPYTFFFLFFPPFLAFPSFVTWRWSTDFVMLVITVDILDCLRCLEVHSPQSTLNIP